VRPGRLITYRAFLKLRRIALPSVSQTVSSLPSSSPHIIMGHLIPAGTGQVELAVMDIHLHST